MTFLPQWTRRVAMEGSGRDPLGLSRVSDKLTDFLLPGIITTTDRARYYSFYTWAWADIAQWQQSAEKKIGDDVIEVEFQRREAAFALASLLNGKGLPIVGVRKVELYIKSGSQDEIDTEFLVLPSNRLGGFGQYYGGCLHGLGLVSYPNDDGMPVPTLLGERVANAFATATADAPYLNEPGIRQSRYVARDILEQSREVYSLDGLGEPSATAEREELIRMFFSLGERGASPGAVNRQATLALLLHVLSAYEEAGVAVPGRDVNAYVVFWPHYYGELRKPAGGGHPYRPPPALENVQGFWRHFCAHQFATFAMEEFLTAVLTVLGGHGNGLTEPELIESLIGPSFSTFLEEKVGLESSSPAALLNSLGIAKVAGPDGGKVFTARFSGTAKLNEWLVYQIEGKSAGDRLGRSLTIMTILYGRWRGKIGEPHFRDVKTLANQEFWLGTLFPWVETWFMGADWPEAIRAILRDIVTRHDTVKFQKRKLDASWLEDLSGRFLKQQDLEPDFRSSRHRNAATILRDLGLIAAGSLDDPFRITPGGRDVLDEVLRQTR